MYGSQAFPNKEPKENKTKIPKLLAKIIESLPDIFFVVDQDLNVVLTNIKNHQAFLKIGKKTPACYEIVRNRHKKCDPCPVIEVFKTGKAKNLEYKDSLDGNILNIQLIPVFDDNGRIVMVLEHLRDITQTKKHDQVLAGLSAIKAGLAELGKKMLGFPSRDDVSRILLEKTRELTQSPCGMVDYWEEKSKRLIMAAFVGKELTENREQNYSASAWRKNMLQWFCDHNEPLLINDSDKGVPWQNSYQDQLPFKRMLSVPAFLGDELMGRLTLFNAERGYTQQDLAVVELMAGLYAFAMQRVNDDQVLVDHQTRLRTLAAKLSAAENRERRLIASDLHDSVGQYLSMANQRLKMLRLDQPPPPHILDQIIMLIDKAVLETRSLTAQLSPPVLYLIGLEAALEWLSEISPERFGLEIELTEQGPIKFLNHEAREFLFRAVLELLSNVAKYAETDSVEISLFKNDSFLKLSVIDHGTGFDYTNGDPFESNGFGLFSIRERITALGGQFEISSEPQKGTTATLIWPFEQATENKKVGT